MSNAASKVAALTTFAAFDAAFAANRTADGWIVDIELARRLLAREREIAISVLRMSPEGETRDSRYAATTGELRKWAELHGPALIDRPIV